MVKQITVDGVSDLPAVIDVNTAARLAGVSSHHMSQMLARGEVKGVKFASRWRVDTSALCNQLGIGEGVNE